MKTENRDTKEAQSSQEWLSERKELAYEALTKKLSLIFEEEGQEGIRDYFLKLINAALQLDQRRIISSELLSSVELSVVSSASASQIAGKTIERPAFVFTDLDQWKKFHHTVFSGEEGVDMGEGWKKCSTAALAIPFNIRVPDGSIEEVKLIFSPLNRGSIGHEVRHTIDPQVLERAGYDRILEELFAYYHDDILDEEEVKRCKNQPDDLWQGFIASVWGSRGAYYKTFSESEKQRGGKELRYEEYGRLVKKAVDKIRLLADKHGHLETQRLLAQTKTLDELFSYT